jgi:hypothetical protein
MENSKRKYVHVDEKKLSDAYDKFIELPSKKGNITKIAKASSLDPKRFGTYVKRRDNAQKSNQQMQRGKYFDVEPELRDLKAFKVFFSNYKANNRGDLIASNCPGYTPKTWRNFTRKIWICKL